MATRKDFLLARGSALTKAFAGWIVIQKSVFFYFIH